jgi:hypothetical protein
MENYFHLLGFTLESLHEVNYTALFYYVNPNPIIKSGFTEHIRTRVVCLELLIDLDPIQCYWLLMKYEPTYNGEARPCHLLARIADLFDGIKPSDIREFIGRSSGYDSYRYNRNLNATRYAIEGTPV